MTRGINIKLSQEDYDTLMQVIVLEAESATTPASVLSWNASRRQLREVLEHICLIQ